MTYKYGAKEPEKLKIKDMTPRQKELLIDAMATPSCLSSR